VLTAARRLRILPTDRPNATIGALVRAARQADEAAAALLGERARVLGTAIALLSDVLNPDDLVVGGQAFTEYPEGMRVMTAAYAERSVLLARDPG
jgi:predicted NBD/HSP70 family sugar kinase